MEVIKVGVLLDVLLLSVDSEGQRFGGEWPEVHKKAIGMESVKCVESEDSGVVAGAMTSTIKINTMKDGCSHEDSGDCKKAIRRWFDLRYHIMHPKAGQLHYQGKNVPYLEEIKAEGPKKIEFPLHGSYIMVSE